MSDQVTFDAYVMFCGASEVPEQNGLTKEEVINLLPETAEHYEVDLVLHIHTDSFPTGFEAEDVTDEIFETVFEDMIDDEPDPEYQSNGYKGRLQEMIDRYVDAHPDTIVVIKQRGEELD